MPYETRNCRFIEPANQPGEQSPTLVSSGVDGGGDDDAHSLTRWAAPRVGVRLPSVSKVYFIYMYIN